MTAFLRLRVLGQEAQRDAIVNCHVSALFFKKIKNKFIQGYIHVPKCSLHAGLYSVWMYDT
jgi:hypothetical protein